VSLYFTIWNDPKTYDTLLNHWFTVLVFIKKL